MLSFAVGHDSVVTCYVYHIIASVMLCQRIRCINYQ